MIHSVHMRQVFLSELNCPEGLSFSEMYKENEAGTKATGSLVTSFDNIEIDSKIKDRFHFNQR